MRHRPFFIAGHLQAVPLRVRAPHRGLLCMGNSPCMGLFFRLRLIPCPRPAYEAYDSLTSLMDMNMLDRDFLLTLATMAVQRFKQGGVGSGKLVRLGEVFAPSFQRLAAKHGPPVAFHGGVMGSN